MFQQMVIALNSNRISEFQDVLNSSYSGSLSFTRRDGISERRKGSQEEVAEKLDPSGYKKNVQAMKKLAETTRAALTAFA